MYIDCHILFIIKILRLQITKPKKFFKNFFLLKLELLLLFKTDKQSFMNKKIILSILTAIILFPFDSAFAQNNSKRFGIEVLGGINEYGGDRGTRYFYASKPTYQGAGASFGYYLTPSFDALLTFDMGEIGHIDESFEKEGFRASIWNFMPSIRFNLANDKLLSADSKFRPFLQGGWGLFNYVTTIRNDRIKKSYSRFAVQWALGGGAKFALTESLDVMAQIMYNYAYDDNLDGLPYSPFVHTRHKLMDAYITQRIGLAYNFGANEGAYKISEQEDDIPKEVKTKLDLFSKQIQFETGKAVLLPESYPALDSVANIMLAYPNINALVEGHTDNVGDDEENMLLSQERANAVLKCLTDRRVDASRISAQGFGETQPIKTNNTPEGRAANRRCVVKPYIKK